MKEIVIFAGTTEGRELSEVLAAAGIRHTISVATEYGELVLAPHPLVTIHRKRMDREEMREWFCRMQFQMVVDATHPYAELVTQNIRWAAEEAGIPCRRLHREMGTTEDGGTWRNDSREEPLRYFSSHDACAEALTKVEGNILLTTGSKNLGEYCRVPGLKERLFVRVLPGQESLRLCMEQGLTGKQILALQGPFSQELNEAMMRQYQIAWVVTKKSGKTGGYEEKVAAAKAVGAGCFVVLPEKRGRLKITLAGIGMGQEGCLTTEVRAAIDSAHYLLGAERMIAPYQAKVEKRPYYGSDQILSYLRQQTGGWSGTRNAVVLFSGDTGCYSGCKRVFQALNQEIRDGKLDAEVRILPGISSVSYLASCIGESYDNAMILSIHGKQVEDLVGKIAGSAETFLLMSGAADVRRLGRLLLDAGLGSCQVMAGYQLSYPEQQILCLSPEACLEVEAEGLYTCFIKNPDAEHAQEDCSLQRESAGKQGRLVHGMADGEFIREKVPMTKEEVREVSICKLQLYEGAVVYDVGSGTGSVAVEIAALSPSIQVYALERKTEAVSLIGKNRERFGLSNIHVIETEAPAGMEELPVPTHAFIGGSGGGMQTILQTLYEKNPTMRVVINAVTMETICEIRQALETFPIVQEDVVQMQVSRARKAGSYHLMQAENPVWICSFSFTKGE